MDSSPVLTEGVVRRIFRDPALQSTFMQLEDRQIILDESMTLARLVNTTASRTEPFSRWVRYREGYSPSIVQHILNMFPMDTQSKFLLDPMCGSGSSQIAAQQLGLSSIGTDVSPYAILISRAKTTKLDSAEISQVRTFIDDLEPTVGGLNVEVNETERYLNQYFPPKNFKELVWLKKEILRSFPAAGKVHDFMLLALLAIVEDSSNRKKDGNGLATRPSKVSGVVSLFREHVQTMLSDITCAEWLDTPSMSINKSALEVDETIAEASESLGRELGAVIFSPPYANSFDYYESYKLELLFGDLISRESLGAERKRLVRSYRQMGKTAPNLNLATVELLIDEVMNRLPAKEAMTGVRDGRTRLLPNMLRGYFEDMQRFLVAAESKMPSGSYMAILVDQSAYLGVLIPTDLILAQIAQEQGFAFEKLIICRRAKTSGQQIRMQPLLGGVLRESAVILRR